MSFGVSENILNAALLGCDPNGIEEGLRAHLMTCGGQLTRQDFCLSMDSFRDGAKAPRTVVTGVHRGYIRKQSLCGADVARRLFAADVLLTGLQGETVSGTAAAILGNTDDASWHMALESVPRCEIGRVRAAKSERNAETLGVADSNIRPEFAGRTE